MQRGYKKITIFDLYRVYWTSVFWCLQDIYRVTLIGVFLGRCNKLARNILIKDRNTGTQPNCQKSLSKSGILSQKNSCSHFSSPRSQQVCSYVQNQQAVWLGGRRNMPPPLLTAGQRVCKFKGISKEILRVF